MPPKHFASLRLQPRHLRLKHGVCVDADGQALGEIFDFELGAGGGVGGGQVGVGDEFAYAVAVVAAGDVSNAFAVGEDGSIIDKPLQVIDFSLILGFTHWYIFGH